MSGKIERLATQARGKVERSQVETPAKTAEVSRNAPAVDNAFTNEGPSKLETGNGGTPLTRSARPDSLWGGPERRNADRSLEPAALMKLSPEQKVEKLAELQAQRDGLHVKILERVIELEAKWDKAPTGTKQEALEHYANNSDEVDPETRRELRQLIRQAQGAQHRIDRLKERREGMTPSRRANAQEKRERAELARELRAARKEQKEAVKDATAVVDDKGLKVDRLAVTEQVIDPSAPPAGSEKSLLGMVTSFFSLSWVCDWLGSKISASASKTQDDKIAEELHQHVLRSHQEEQADKREGLKQLALEVSLRKR